MISNFPLSHSILLRTFTCSRSSRSNELIKVSQQSLTNQVITFDLIGKQWPLDTLIEWNARVENSKSFRSTLKPQEGLSLNDCQHATCLDNSSECSSDIKMLLTSVLWRRGVTLLKNWTFCEWFFLISGETRVWCPVFFLLYRNVITTHISYWFFSEIPPQDRDGVAATVLPPGCLNRKVIEGKFWKVVPKFPPPFRKTLVHLDGFIIPKSLHNTPKCVKWAKVVPLSTAQTNMGYPTFFHFPAHFYNTFNMCWKEKCCS